MTIQVNYDLELFEQFVGLSIFLFKITLLEGTDNRHSDVKFATGKKNSEQIFLE